MDIEEYLLSRQENARRTLVRESWDAEFVTLRDVEMLWWGRYHPAGYGTSVVGRHSDDGKVLLTTMNRASSCD